MGVSQIERFYDRHMAEAKNVGVDELPGAAGAEAKALRARNDFAGAVTARVGGRETYALFDKHYGVEVFADNRRVATGLRTYDARQPWDWRDGFDK
jgi:hypothetical protein